MDLHETARRIRRGDKDALRSLVEAYGGEIYKRALEKCGDQALAREATRQTFRQIVSGIQTQEDEHGWKLWIDMLAKTNIYTYSMLATDIAVMESELEKELFPAMEKGDLPVGKAAAPPRVLNTVSAQVPVPAGALNAASSPREARPQTLDVHPEPAYGAESAGTAACGQPVYAQPLCEQPAYEPPVYEPPACEQPASMQAEAVYAAQAPVESEARRAGESEPEEEKHPLPPREKEKGRPHKHRTRRRHAYKPVEEPAHAARGKPSAGRVVSILLLALVCALLIWVVLGVAMSMSLLPKWELGYAWFNQNVFKMF